MSFSVVPLRYRTLRVPFPNAEKKKCPLWFPLQKLANCKADTSRFISANLPCNKFKNRLVNILPLESSRVCLLPIRGVEGSDYINASFIDGYRSVSEPTIIDSLIIDYFLFYSAIHSSLFVYGYRASFFKCF